MKHGSSDGKKPSPKSDVGPPGKQQMSDANDS